MNSKLTLRMDKELIDAAKRRSEKSGRSVSKMVADYFDVLRKGENLDEEPTVEASFTPTVRLLLGSMKGRSVSEEDYKVFLEEKHR